MTAAQQVALWAKKAREATVARNEAIAAMRAEGASLRAIAAAAKLTPPAIAKILHRDSLMRGMEQAASGQLVDRGSFAQYVEE